MTKTYQSLGELEAAYPESFRNPVVSDAEFDAQMARNRLRAAAEDAAAEMQAACERQAHPCSLCHAGPGWEECERCGGTGVEPEDDDESEGEE